MLLHLQDRHHQGGNSQQNRSHDKGIPPGSHPFSISRSCSWKPGIGVWPCHPRAGAGVGALLMLRGLLTNHSVCQKPPTIEGESIPGGDGLNTNHSVCQKPPTIEGEYIPGGDGLNTNHSVCQKHFIIEGEYIPGGDERPCMQPTSYKEQRLCWVGGW